MQRGIASHGWLLCGARGQGCHAWMATLWEPGAGATQGDAWGCMGHIAPTQCANLKAALPWCCHVLNTIMVFNLGNENMAAPWWG